MDLLSWKHPWAALIAGPSGAGKTVFVKNFLHYRDSMSDTVFERIIFYYSEWQPTYLELGKNIEFLEGVPQPSDYNDDPRAKLVIIDDLMTEASGKTVVNMFTKGSHHRNMSIIFITQNLFHHGLREISLNANYIVVFKNPRDKAQIQYLSRQIYPENSRFAIEAYLDATSKPYGYLLFDLKQSTPDNLRLRTNIFPNTEFPVVYIPIKALKRSERCDQVPVVRL